MFAWAFLVYFTMNLDLEDDDVDDMGASRDARGTKYTRLISNDQNVKIDRSNPFSSVK